MVAGFTSGGKEVAPMSPPDDVRFALEGASTTAAVPAYLRETYRWAYLDPFNVRLLDHDAVVTAILFGNNGRLRRALLAEITPGQRVLQAAHVYGSLIPRMARKIGPAGRLDVIDVAPLQVARCRRKLEGLAQARVRLADAAHPGGGFYDVVSCYFLLHELPGGHKRAVVDALLGSVAPGGKVVFVDYHRPRPGHPLRWLLTRVFARLEPFAAEMWASSVADFATRSEAFEWRTRLFFGGLYQVTVATRRPSSPT